LAKPRPCAQPEKPGFNHRLLPNDREDIRIVPELEPQGDEIVVMKTADSALTGPNLRRMRHRLGFEDLSVIAVEDCCASCESK